MRSTPTSSQVAERLGRATFFRGLSEAALTAIAKQAELRSLKRGQVLWRHGSFAYELAFVWEGRLDVARSIADRVTYRAVRINEVIGFSNAMGRAVCTVDVVAGEPTRLLLVPGDVLRGLVPKHPEIAFRALEYMGELLGRLSDEVEMLHHSTLEGRLVRKLRDLAGGRKEVSLTHQELANLVGARRESVTRALKVLEKRKMIARRRGRIEVVDLDG